MVYGRAETPLEGGTNVNRWPENDFVSPVEVELMVMDHHRHGSDHSLRGSSGGLRSSASTSTGLTVAVKNNPDLVPFIQQQQSKLLISSYLEVIQ